MNILHVHKRKLFNIILLFGFITILLLFIQSQYIPLKIYRLFHKPDSIFCYRIQQDSLPSITDASPRKGKSIFFHETSCNSLYNDKISITARQACAVESAARLNPNFDVYLLFTSPGVIKLENDESDDIIKGLLKYKNIRMMHLNYEKYVRGTPVEELYNSGKIEGSVYAQSHASDVLRYLTLWKYGGIYLDLDVIIIKSLENLKPNYAGIESDKDVAAGVLSFEAGGKGHEMAAKCIHDLQHHFNGQDWGNNGPGVITRLLNDICDETLAKNMLNKDCGGFTAYPSNAFYPVPWKEWNMYFDVNASQAVLNMTKESIAVHVWNKHSHKTKLPLTSNAPYLYFAKKYCPKVVEACREVF